MEFADPSVIVRRRPTKHILPRLLKKRKIDHKIEEIGFDFDSRADYLTGFHKRKVQRAKQAQLEAAKKEREERISLRKQLREERKQELEEHVNAVNAMLNDANVSVREDFSDGDSNWNGFEDPRTEVEPVDHEQEYIDEDRYTVVTVEAVDVSKEGLVKADGGDAINGITEAGVEAPAGIPPKKKSWPKKEKKKKFRYENKAERKTTRGKQKAGNKARADARKGAGS